MVELCPICKKENIDTNCTVKGLWKVGTRGAFNKGELRFNINIGINCFDDLRNGDII